MSPQRLTIDGYGHSIQTMYRGYEFRSRLEAKWAAFFDLCGWEWSYEPVDLDGWIPDFAIGWKPFLVEVKPFFSEDQWGDTVAKARKAGHDGDLICFGADATWGCSDSELPRIGFLSDIDGFWDLHFGVTEGNNNLGLCPMDGGWENKIWEPPVYSEQCTHPNKWSRVWGCDERGVNSVEILKSKWAEACNISKWIPHKQAASH